MNVLFLATWYPYPPDNGSKQRTAYLLQALACKHDVSLLAFDFDTDDSDSGKEPNPELVNVNRIAVNPFARAKSGRLLDQLSFHPRTTRVIPAMRDAVSERLREGTVDVVISSTFVCAAYALDASPPTARVLEEHNSLTGWILGSLSTANKFNIAPATLVELAKDAPF